MKRQYIEVDWEGADYHGFPIPTPRHSYPSEEEGEVALWAQFESVLAEAKHGNFSGVRRLLTIYDSADWLLSGACADLMGEIGNRQFFDELRPAVTSILDPTYSVGLGRIEGRNVCRHLDLTTSNHGSDPGATPPLPTTEMQSMPAQDAIEAGRCPCCGEALHAWQKDDDGEPLTPIAERDYWEKKIKRREDEQRDKLSTIPESKRKARAAAQAKLAHWSGMRQKLDRLLALKEASRQRVREAKARGVPAAEAACAGCLNVNEHDGQGCGTYFDTTGVEYRRSLVSLGDPLAKQTHLRTPSLLASHDFSSTQYQAFVGRVGKTPRRDAIDMWQAANPSHRLDPVTAKMDHKTPKQAGGCNSGYNTAPSTWYSDPNDTCDPCTQVEHLQSELENL